MKEYDVPEIINEKELIVLRKYTKLGSNASYQIAKAKKNAELLREIYVKMNPTDPIGIDYDDAMYLEYQLRMNALQAILEKKWLDNNNGLSMQEFTNKILNELISKENC